MGCEAANVTKENIEMLEMMEEILSYPPRFRFKFSCLNKSLALDSIKVRVTFSGTNKALQISITLEKPKTLISENSSTLQVTPSLTLNITPENDASK